MIKKLFISKLTSSVAAEFGVIGLKIVEIGSFHKIGICLAVVSFTLLLVGMVVHAQNEAVANAPATTKRSRQSRRSRAPRTR